MQDDAGVRKATSGRSLAGRVVALIAALAAVACGPQDDGRPATPTEPRMTQGASPSTPTMTASSAPTPQPSPSREPGFQATGNLTRDNPGQPPGVWVLVYDAPGSAARTTELEFVDESECLQEGSAVPCASLRVGDRVRVQGDSVNGAVRVVSIQILQRASPQR